MQASTNGKGLDSWKASTIPCGTPDWARVTCDTGAVVTLNIQGPPAPGATSPFKGLSGTISPALGDISSLRNLILQLTSSISGTIPNSLGHLTALETLVLSYNTKLSGTIPDFFDQFTSLRVIDMHGSLALSGTIPASFSRLTALHTLHLENTKVTGCTAFCKTHHAISECECPRSMQNHSTTMINDE